MSPGEDRWLCTLLLQQGYKLEYCAAADASTYAPETFNEFFNQRRRWIPSTLANMMDLLSDYHRTVLVNDNISFLYMIYQAVVMGASLLAPATGDTDGGRCHPRRHRWRAVLALAQQLHRRSHLLHAGVLEVQGRYADNHRRVHEHRLRHTHAGGHCRHRGANQSGHVDQSQCYVYYDPDGDIHTRRATSPGGVLMPHTGDFILPVYSFRFPATFYLLDVEYEYRRVGHEGNT